MAYGCIAMYDNDVWLTLCVGSNPKVIKAFPANVIQKSGAGKPILITSGTSARPVTPAADTSNNSVSRQPQVVIVGSTGELHSSTNVLNVN